MLIGMLDVSLLENLLTGKELSKLVTGYLE